VNVLSESLKKKGYEFPMKVGAFSYDTHSDAKNILKVFEMKYKLEMYEVLRPMFDPNGYARDVLQIRSVIKHITTIEDYWADCKNKFESHDHAFARLTVDQLKMYKVNIDVEGVEDDGQNMYRNTYLIKLRGTPISSDPYEYFEEELDILMAQIYKRTRKWVEWTTARRSQRKSTTAQASPIVTVASSSQGGTSGATLAIT